MTMRKYIVTVHRDGTLSAVEYDEPSDYPRQYRPGTDELLRKAHNAAVESVMRLLGFEIAHCKRKERECLHDAEENARWNSKVCECIKLRSVISNLYMV